MTAFYSDEDVLNVHGSKLTAVYYIYNVKKGVLEDKVVLNSEQEYDKNGTYTYDGENKDKILAAYKAVYNRTLSTNSCNEWGRAFSAYMKQGKICDQIIVFIGSPKDGVNTMAKLQTAPYYTDKDEVGYKGGGDNPFGPR